MSHCMVTIHPSDIPNEESRPRFLLSQQLMAISCILHEKNSTTLSHDPLHLMHSHSYRCSIVDDIPGISLRHQLASICITQGACGIIFSIVYGNATNQ